MLEQQRLLANSVEVDGDATHGSFRRRLFAVTTLFGCCIAAVVVPVARASGGAGRFGSLEGIVGLEAKKRSRLGSFLVIGDWGWDEKVHGNTYGSDCQRAIGDLMHEEMEKLGDVQFIINVGDSFYPNGLTSKDDPQWDRKWRNRYSKELRSVPWYSVYGNHDYQHDPCACGDGARDCAQVNGDIDDLDTFYMPNTSWFKHHPELDLEVLALDMNHLMWAWDKAAPPNKRCPLDCAYTSCQEKCEANLKARAEEAFDLFFQRMQKSTAKNMVVFSHYPTDYFWEKEEFLAALRNNSQRHIEFFGGHRHNVDNTSTISIEPNSNWLVGGGGGWGCDGDQQGFIVGEMRTGEKTTTRPVLLEDPSVCCGPAGTPPPGGWPPDTRECKLV
jgi:hypothetical protein